MECMYHTATTIVMEVGWSGGGGSMCSSSTQYQKIVLILKLILKHTSSHYWCPISCWLWKNYIRLKEWKQILKPCPTCIWSWMDYIVQIKSDKIWEIHFEARYNYKRCSFVNNHLLGSENRENKRLKGLKERFSWCM